MASRIAWDEIRAKLQANEQRMVAALEAGSGDTERIFQLRAERLATRERSSENEGDIQVLQFWVRGERYALPIADTTEVLQAARWTPVPQAPPAFAGVMNVRGRVRPVLDLAILGGLAAKAPQTPWAVVARLDGNDVALLVDSVDSIQNSSLGALQPPPEGEVNGLLAAAKGITPDGITILDATKLALAAFSRNGELT